MFGRATSVVAGAAAVLSLLFQHAAADAVLRCSTNIYADGFIYRNGASTTIGSFPAVDTFPLYLATTTQVGARLEYAKLARQLSTHNYKVLDSFLYINASTGAFEPIGFVSGSNTTLGAGETTYGFLTGYGLVLWYDTSRLSPAVAAGGATHAQGFQWVPVAGGDGGVTQLYWNQTQYDVAATEGSQQLVDPSTATFGFCTGDYEAVIEKRDPSTMAQQHQTMSLP